MSDSHPLVHGPLSVQIRAVAFMLLRMLVFGWLVFTAYYDLPVQQQEGKSDAPFLLLHVLVFAAIVGIQVPWITRSRHPLLRSIEATVLTTLIYLTLFARIYLSATFSNHDAFNQVLTHTKALYFTVTVFATVGFGDIVAVAEPVQVLVTVQMLLNLVVIGVVIRVLMSAGTRGMERVQSGEEPPPMNLPKLRRRRADESSAGSDRSSGEAGSGDAGAGDAGAGEES